MNKLICIILVGISGSGKSTLAKKLAEQHDAVICSADDYFLNTQGHYIWDGTKLGESHRFCQHKAHVAMTRKQNVVIDNTNIKAKDRKIYEEMAVQFGYECHLEVVNVTDVDLCASRNVHGVPKEKIEQMVKSLKAQCLI